VQPCTRDYRQRKQTINANFSKCKFAINYVGDPVDNIDYRSFRKKTRRLRTFPAGHGLATPDLTVSGQVKWAKVA